MSGKLEHLTQTATLLRKLACSDGGNKDFLAVARFLERLAEVYRDKPEPNAVNRLDS